MEYNANKFKQQGNQAYKSGDYRTALNFYNKAIQIDPRDPAFYLNRALCYYNMRHYVECVKECDKSLHLNPAYIKALKKKSAASIQMLKFEDALNALKQAYAVEKTQATSNEIQEVEHFISNYNKYIEALRNEDYAEALSCVSYLAGKIHENKQLKLVKIQCLAKTGATDDALKQLRSLQQQKSPETMYLKGLIELYSGDSAKAKSYFSEGMRLDPSNEKCHKALQKANKCQRFKQQGNQLIKANNHQAAEKRYTQALNLDPYNKKLNSIIYSNRALTYMKRKMWTKAAEDLNKSIELNPNYLKSYVKRAEVNMQRGQYSAAIHDYAKIQQLDPKIDLKTKISQAKKKEKQAKKKDYYAILGISKNATDEQIKKAYKKMALKYHPDRNRNKSQVEQDEASKMFRDINQAQDILTDPEKRKLYDSGAMYSDPEMGGDFSDFSHNMGGFGNMGGFTMGGMGGNGQTFTFKMNGQEMGGIDPSQIFSMFMGGNGFGGFGNRASAFNKSSNSQQKNKFPGFEDFDFQGF